MSDSQLRELERRYSQGDLPVAELLRARQRTGNLSTKAIKTAAYLGDPAAKELTECTCDGIWAHGPGKSQIVCALSCMTKEGPQLPFPRFMAVLLAQHEPAFLRAAAAVARCELARGEQRTRRQRTVGRRRDIVRQVEYLALGEPLNSKFGLGSVEECLTAVSGERSGGFWARIVFYHLFHADVELTYAYILSDAHPRGSTASERAAIVRDVVPWLLGLGDPLRQRVEDRRAQEAPRTGNVKL